MAGKNVFNDKDSMDISELASLNDDISPELIEQLQQKLTQDAKNLNAENTAQNQPAFNINDDTTLFEEPSAAANTENTQEKELQKEPAQVKKDINLDKNFDDNFIKKYKAIFIF